MIYLATAPEVAEVERAVLRETQARPLVPRLTRCGDPRRRLWWASEVLTAASDT